MITNEHLLPLPITAPCHRRRARKSSEISAIVRGVGWCTRYRLAILLSSRDGPTGRGLDARTVGSIGAVHAVLARRPARQNLPHGRASQRHACGCRTWQGPLLAPPGSFAVGLLAPSCRGNW